MTHSINFQNFFINIKGFKEIFESKQKELDVRYHELAVERVSCKIDQIQTERNNDNGYRKS